MGSVRERDASGWGARAWWGWGAGRRRARRILGGGGREAEEGRRTTRVLTERGLVFFAVNE